MRPFYVTAQRVVLDPDDPSSVTTWPRPDDPKELAWKVKYSPQSLTQSERFELAAFIQAYASLCMHPARNQRQTGRLARRIGKALQ